MHNVNNASIKVVNKWLWDSLYLGLYYLLQHLQHGSGTRFVCFVWIGLNEKHTDSQRTITADIDFWYLDI